MTQKGDRVFASCHTCPSIRFATHPESASVQWPASANAQNRLRRGVSAGQFAGVVTPHHLCEWRSHAYPTTRPATGGPAGPTLYRAFSVGNTGVDLRRYPGNGAGAARAHHARAQPGEGMTQGASRPRSRPASRGDDQRQGRADDSRRKPMGEGRHLDHTRARGGACRAAPYFHYPD